MSTKNNVTHATATATASAPGDRAELAYKSILTLARGLDDSKLDYFNADVPFAVSLVLAKMPKLLTLRADVAKLHDFEIVNLDNLESYALALSFSAARYTSRRASPEVLSRLQTEASKLRKLLKRDAVTQLDRAIFEPGSLGELSGKNSFRGTASDLCALGILYRDHAARLVGCTAITAAELARAAELSLQLLTAAGLNEATRTPRAQELALELRRVFTLFNRAYNEVRAAATYLRRNKGDVDEFAPSLFARRTTKRKAADKPAKPAESPATDTATAAAAPAPEKAAP